MINKKKCSIGLITAILLLSFVSTTFTVQAYSLRTVYGMVYIDGETAPDGITVNLTFPVREFTNDTYAGGNYAMTFKEDNYEEGTFSVYYQGVWYPTEPPTVELGDEHEIIYHVDLYVTLPPNNPPDAPFNPTPEDNEENVSIDTTLSVTVTDPDEDPMLVSFYNASDDTLIDYVEDIPSGGAVAINWIGLEYNTTYCWYAVASDGEFDTQSPTWCFTTIEEGHENNPPDAPFNPTPEDNEENVSLDAVLSVTVTDPDEDPMLVSFYNASDDSLIDFVEDIPSGGAVAINWFGLEYNTTYCWYAVASDGEFDTQSDTWCFTTVKEGQENEPPTVEITKPEKALYLFNIKIRNFIFRNALIIGKITIEAEAEDDKGIEKVEFYINGKLMGNDTSDPYTYDWKWSRPRLFHLFRIKVVAYDYEGATAQDSMKVRKFL